MFVAKRKCLGETGVSGESIQVLGVYNTFNSLPALQLLNELDKILSPWNRQHTGCGVNSNIYRY